MNPNLFFHTKIQFSCGITILQYKFTEIFALETESHYGLRQCNDFRILSIRTVYHGSKSISFLGPKIWVILPDEIKQ